MDILYFYLKNKSSLAVRFVLLILYLGFWASWVDFSAIKNSSSETCFFQTWSGAIFVTLFTLVLIKLQLIFVVIWILVFHLGTYIVFRRRNQRWVGFTLNSLVFVILAPAKAQKSDFKLSYFVRPHFPQFHFHNLQWRLLEVSWKDLVCTGRTPIFWEKIYSHD